mmetsp:Transcript_44622/g.128027  ORF Transcript_44622/g.128027 Transcript_44622/m.128027 type:complete len:230 (-) Transcript_44622:1524-2213(-)
MPPPSHGFAHRSTVMLEQHHRVTLLNANKSASPTSKLCMEGRHHITSARRSAAPAAPPAAADAAVCAGAGRHSSKRPPSSPAEPGHPPPRGPGARSAARGRAPSASCPGPQMPTCARRAHPSGGQRGCWAHRRSHRRCPTRRRRTRWRCCRRPDSPHVGAAARRAPASWLRCCEDCRTRARATAECDASKTSSQARLYQKETPEAADAMDSRKTPHWALQETRACTSGR